MRVASLNTTIQALRRWGFTVTDEPRTIRWGHGTLVAEFSLTGDGVIRLARLGSPDDAPDEHHPHAPVPLVARTVIPWEAAASRFKRVPSATVTTPVEPSMAKRPPALSSRV